jgi:hypothetical protein
MMITVVTTLDTRKDRRGSTPVELDTRLAEGAVHLKNSACRANGSTILPCSRDSESLRHFPCRVLEISLHARLSDKQKKICRGRDVGVRKVQIFFRKLTANTGDCAARRCAALLLQFKMKVLKSASTENSLYEHP